MRLEIEWLQTLELEPPCELDDIKQARKRMAKRFHPDLAGASNPAERAAMEDKLKRVNDSADRVIEWIELNGSVQASSVGSSSSTGSPRGRSGARSSYSQGAGWTEDNGSRAEQEERTRRRSQEGQREWGTRRRRNAEDEKRQADAEYASAEYEKYRARKFGRGRTGPRASSSRGPSAAELRREHDGYRNHQQSLVRARSALDLTGARLLQTARGFADSDDPRIALWALYLAYAEWAESDTAHAEKLRAAERFWRVCGTSLDRHAIVTEADWQATRAGSAQVAGQRNATKQQVADITRLRFEDLLGAMRSDAIYGIDKAGVRLAGAALRLREMLDSSSGADADLRDAIGRDANGSIDIRIGRIKAIRRDRGFAFIAEIGEQRDVFLHASELTKDEFGAIQPGALATFRSVVSSKGVKAVDVELLSAAT